MNILPIKITSNDELIPAIICTADLSYYLIGAEDKQGKFYNIYSEDVKKPLHAPTLEQAKRVLKTILDAQYNQRHNQRHNQQSAGSSVEHKVIIELKNPYDEMIGTQTYGPTRMLVKLVGMTGDE